MLKLFRRYKIRRTIGCDILLLCTVALGLFGSKASSAQGNSDGYQCLHLFSLSQDSDWAYDINLNVVLPQARLSGLTHQIHQSADGKWFALETAIGHWGVDNDNNSPLLRSKLPLLYVGPIINGNVLYTRDNPLGFVQTQMLPLSLRWSPQKAQLAYLYVRGTTQEDRDAIPQITLVVFDVATKSKHEVNIRYPSRLGPPLIQYRTVSRLIKPPLIQWSPDGQYLAVTTLTGTTDNIGISIYDSTNLTSVSSIAAPVSGPVVAPIAIKWLPDRNRLAIFWTDGNGKAGQLTLVKPGEEPQTTPFDARQVIREEQFVWSPDGAYLAIYDGNRVTLLEVGNAPASKTANSLPGVADAIHWTADSQSLILLKRKRAASGSVPGQLVAYHTRTKTFQTIIDNVVSVDDDAAFFPQERYRRFESDPVEDNSTILVTYEAGGQFSSGVDLVNLDTLERRQLLTSRPDRISWSPDHSTFVIFQVKTTDTGGGEQYLYWGTRDGRIFRTLNKGELLKNILAPNADPAVMWLDGTPAPYIAFVAEQQGKTTTGFEISQSVVLVNLSIGISRILVGGSPAVALVQNRPKPGVVHLSWIEMQADQSPMMFVGGYDLGGKRLFRYSVNVENTENYPVPVQGYHAPVGNRVAFLVGFRAQVPGLHLLYSPKGGHLEEAMPAGSSDGNANNYNGYSGIMWSPDGKRFAAYNAFTIPLSDEYGYPEAPIFERIDIYTAEGVYIATVPIQSIAFENRPAVYGILWKRCKDAFPDPYRPADLKFGYWVLPPG